MPKLQRRSKPVNGSDFAVSVVGVVVVVVGAVSLVGVVLGVLVSFEGEVPVLGLFGSWL